MWNPGTFPFKVNYPNLRKTYVWLKLRHVWANNKLMVEIHIIIWLKNKAPEVMEHKKLPSGRPLFIHFLPNKIVILIRLGKNVIGRPHLVEIL